MASINMRNLIDGLKRRLRTRPPQTGGSMEHSARNIPRATPDNASPPSTDLARAIRARFAPLGGVELDLPPREPMRQPPKFQ